MSTKKFKKGGSADTCARNPRNCVRNPYTGRMIKKYGETWRDVFKYHESSLKLEGDAYKRGEGQYQNVPKEMFCGPAGGAPQGTFPVNNESRCRAALSYARDAPNPRGIERCAVRIAKKHGWRCGVDSEKLRERGIKASYGRSRRRASRGRSRRRASRGRSRRRTSRGRSRRRSRGGGADVVFLGGGSSRRRRRGGAMRRRRSLRRVGEKGGGGHAVKIYDTCLKCGLPQDVCACPTDF